MHAVQDHYEDPILDSMGSREILIDNRGNSANHENYQVELEIDKRHLFFGDQEALIFVDENLQILNYWNEAFPDKVWLKTKKIQASAMCKLKMLSGGLIGDKGGASSGDNTFKFFDDFEREGLRVNKSLVTANGLGTASHNTVSYIERALWTFNNNRYIAYISNGGDVMVGKRSLPSGSWSLNDTGYNVAVADQHEIVSLGIDYDGYIHISYGMHGVALKYARSNNVEDPSAFTVQSMTGQDENSVTYPRFFMTNNLLFFSYRSGTSSAGNQMLNKYNTTTKAWSVLHHPFVNAEGKAAYLDNFAVDNSGNIHTSFCFRISNSPITTADYSYAYSDNNGSTWKKSDGSAYSMPITRTNAEKFESGTITGLINQNAIDVDGNGHPHIAYWKSVAAVSNHVNYFHAWHNGTSWQIQQLTSYTDTPTSVITGANKELARPGILINRTSNSAYILTRHGEDGNITIFKADSPYSTWPSKNLGEDAWGWQEFSGVDYDEWHSSHNLYLLASRVSGSNPQSVHILKSDLENTETLSCLDMGKWKKVGAYNLPSISDGIATFHKIGTDVHLSSKAKHLTYGRIVEASIKYDGDVATKGGFLCPVGNDPLDTSDQAQLNSYASDTETQFRCKNEDSLGEGDYAEQFPTSYERMGISLLSGEIKAWRDGINKSTITINVPDEDLYVGFREWDGGYVYLNWIAIREYSSPEPTAEVGMMI